MTRLGFGSALFAALALLAACGPPPPPPVSIAFSTVPPAAEGGSERVAPVAGRVVGAKPGQQVVLFARSSTGVWWIQPLTLQPFTAIAADATWKNSIHLGVEYAALLVEPEYRPPPTADMLPKVGGPVVAVAVSKGTGVFLQAPRKHLTFSGYDWEVRQTASDRGGANEYHPDNAWIDAEGLLHLKLRQRDGQWTSAEVILTRTLGYGTYAFVVRDVSQMEPEAAMGMFTWDDEGADQNHRELDIEVSQWGDRKITNAQYVVQPYYVPANVVRFAAPPGRLTYSFRWEPGRVLFRTVRGATFSAGATAVAEHEFRSGVPVPGTETVRINLYFFRFASGALQKEVEVIIERFQYFP